MEYHKQIVFWCCVSGKLWNDVLANHQSNKIHEAFIHPSTNQILRTICSRREARRITTLWSKMERKNLHDRPRSRFEQGVRKEKSDDREDLEIQAATRIDFRIRLSICYSWCLRNTWYRNCLHLDRAIRELGVAASTSRIKWSWWQDFILKQHITQTGK